MCLKMIKYKKSIGRDSFGRFVKGHPYFNVEKKGCFKKGQHNSITTEFQKGIHPKTEFKKGNKPWAKGLTKETDIRIVRLAEKVSIANKGRKLSLETRKKMIGRPNPNPNGFGRSGIRKDLNQFFRSKMEANYARVLNYLGIKWEYEKHRIFLKDCSILLDFWLPDLQFDTEVKGYYGNGGWKIKSLYKEQPNYPIKILDSEGYKTLEKKFKSFIPMWE